jgi:hypothetical protein
MANMCSGLDQRVEHGLELRPRAADHFDHIAGHGLVLERLLHIAGALAQLGDQPDVLDRDHRLRREVCQEGDLLVGERPDLLAVDLDVPENRVTLAQWHEEGGSGGAEIDQCAPVGLAGPVSLLGSQIGNMGQPLSLQDPEGCGPGTIDSRAAREELRIGGRDAARPDRLKALPIVDPQLAKGGLAQLHRLVEHGVEHRRKIAGRIVDDLQDLGNCRLLVEQFAQFCDQPAILHRDHRLRGEALQYRDPLFGERPQFPAVDGEGAEQVVVLEEPHRDVAAGAAELDDCPAPGVAQSIGRVLGHVVDAHGALAAGNAAQCGMRSRLRRVARHELGVTAGDAAQRRGVKSLPVIGAKDAEIPLAQPRRPFEHGVEHRGEIAGRAVDDLQHLGRGALLCQRLLQLGGARVELLFKIGKVSVGHRPSSEPPSFASACIVRMSRGDPICIVCIAAAPHPIGAGSRRGSPGQAR